jgi:hypothetical protein
LKCSIVCRTQHIFHGSEEWPGSACRFRHAVSAPGHRFVRSIADLRREDAF